VAVPDRTLKWLFVGPTVVILAAVTLYPFLYAVVLSFHDYELGQPGIGAFVGLRNYLTVFADWRFANALKVTAAYALLTLPVELLLGFALALLVDLRHGLLDRVRPFLILPMMLTPVAVGVIWKLMLNPEVGIVNYLIRAVGLPGPQWLSDPDLALPTVALVDVWQWTPLMFLIILTGLRALPIEVLEAAQVDGAGYWQRLVSVVLPLMKRVVVVALILRFVDVVRTYDAIYVLTRGGPASRTDVYSMYLFRVGFEFFHEDLAAALSLIYLVLVSLAVSLIFFRVLRFKLDFS
jgi:multiple sugar transport system permease protein